VETITQHQTIERQSDIPISVLLPSGKSFSCIPFQKKNKKWYVRFSSSETGVIELSTGEKLHIKQYSGANRLLLHGPIVLPEGQRRLAHLDGAPFFYLADTWWYAMTKRASLKDLAVLLKDRKQKGFTSVQVVIGGTPEVPFFSKEAQNAGGHPFTSNYRINPAYFDEVDKKIEAILSYGIVPCIFGGWGHHIDLFGFEGAVMLWREILARYASYPVMFCLTGEADIFYGASRLKKFFFHHKRIALWNKIGEWIKEHDPYKRILMVHPHRNMRASKLFRNPSWLDIDSIQSGHSEESRVFMKSALAQAKEEGMPIINLEPWYEGILGNFGLEHQIEALRISLESGACGHSYGAHGVWQMASEDNFMGHWGASNWKHAYKYPGSTAIGRVVKARYNKSL
jgi:hypothetical protein